MIEFNSFYEATTATEKQFSDMGATPVQGGWFKKGDNLFKIVSSNVEEGAFARVAEPKFHGREQEYSFFSMVKKNDDILYDVHPKDISGLSIEIFDGVAVFTAVESVIRADNGQRYGFEVGKKYRWNKTSSKVISDDGDSRFGGHFE